MDNKIISPCISICRTDPVTGYAMVAPGLMKKKRNGKMINQLMNGRKNLRIIVNRMQGWQLNTFKSPMSIRKIKAFVI